MRLQEQWTLRPAEGHVERNALGQMMLQMVWSWEEPSPQSSSHRQEYVVMCTELQTSAQCFRCFVSTRTLANCVSIGQPDGDRTLAPNIEGECCNHDQPQRAYIDSKHAGLPKGVGPQSQTVWPAGKP
jgi:hypothetical protein